jgi:selenocysteine lyase/cysteine desulfurase
MHAALSTLHEFGPAAIEEHLLSITSELRNKLQEIPGVSLVTSYSDQERAGIVTMKVPDRVDAKQVFKEMLNRGVTIALREGQLRYSPHFYCSTADMERAAALTREMM